MRSLQFYIGHSDVSLKSGKPLLFKPSGNMFWSKLDRTRINQLRSLFRLTIFLPLMRRNVLTAEQGPRTDLQLVLIYQTRHSLFCPRGRTKEGDHGGLGAHGLSRTFPARGGLTSVSKQCCRIPSGLRGIHYFCNHCLPSPQVNSLNVVPNVSLLAGIGPNSLLYTTQAPHCNV